MEKAFISRFYLSVSPFVFVALMLGWIEAGFRLGRRVRGRVEQNTKSDVSTIAAAILGVVALLLGFTTSMAVSRFEMRKRLVLEEANAIGTSYLRTKLLPALESTEIASLLSQYVDARLPYADARDLPGITVAREQAARLQNDFWAKAAAYAKNNPDPVRAGLLLQSLNQVIDLEEARWTAFNNHVPAAVVFMDACVALLAASVIGYSLGLSNQRQLFATCMLTLAITLVLAVIIDLDSPRLGLIRVSQQPMIDLQHQLLSAQSLGDFQAGH